MNFVFNGVESSQYNIVVGAYDGAIDETKTLGDMVKVNTVKAPRRTHWNFTDSVYEEPLSFTFPICKMDCTDINDKFFTRSEVAQIMMWLVRDDNFYELKFLDDEYNDVVYLCNITLEENRLGDKTIGFNATVTCNAPWGWSELITTSYDESEFSITSNSEHYGVIYPDAISIMPSKGGQLTLTNTIGDKSVTTVVNNCIAGEKIIFDKNHAIYTGSEHENLFDDFNYVFPGIYRTTTSNVNNFTASSKCEVVLSYREVRKGVAV